MSTILRAILPIISLFYLTVKRLFARRQLGAEAGELVESYTKLSSCEYEAVIDAKKNWKVVIIFIF